MAVDYEYAALFFKYFIISTVGKQALGHKYQNTQLIIYVYKYNMAVDYVCAALFL